MSFRSQFSFLAYLFFLEARFSSVWLSKSPSNICKCKKQEFQIQLSQPINNYLLTAKKYSLSL